MDGKRLLELIHKVKPQSADAQTGLDDDLWEARLLDSFAVVRLVFELEEELDIVFDFKDINARNFRSVTTILKILADKHGIR